MGDPDVLAGLTSPAVRAEGERIAQHPELAAHVYWMVSDVRRQLADDFARRLGVGERSARACVLANVVVDIATYTMEESFEGVAGPGDILLARARRVAAAPRSARPSAAIPDTDSPVDGHPLGAQPPSVIRLVAGDEAPRGRHHPPPRVSVAATSEECAHGPGPPRVARFGGDFAVGHDIALGEARQHRGHRLLERGEIVLQRAASPSAHGSSGPVAGPNGTSTVRTSPNTRRERNRAGGRGSALAWLRAESGMRAEGRRERAEQCTPTWADGYVGALAVCGALGLLALAGCAVTPGNPGAVDVTLSINAFSGPNRPISPLIYGTQRRRPRPSRRTATTVVRMGGNRWTAYNWENNASNAGSDWCFQNDGLLSSSEHARRGGASRRSTQAKSAGAAALVTDPDRRLRRGRQERRLRRAQLGPELPADPRSSRTGRRRARRCR